MMSHSTVSMPIALRYAAKPSRLPEGPEKRCRTLNRRPTRFLVGVEDEEAPELMHNSGSESEEIAISHCCKVWPSLVCQRLRLLPLLPCPPLFWLPEGGGGGGKLEELGLGTNLTGGLCFPFEPFGGRPELHSCIPCPGSLHRLHA